MNAFEPLFTWAHLSDIHMGHGGASHRENQQIVLANLKEDLQNASNRGIPQLDAIFVTGDLAFSGNVRRNDEYEGVSHWLKEIAEAVSVGADKIFVIPGNHDVQRSVELRDRNVARLLRDLRLGNEQLDEALENSGDSTLLRMRLQNYLDFASKFAPTVTNSTSGSAELYWVHRFGVRERLTVRLIGFNTALLCAEETDELGDERRLQLGQKQVAATLVSTPVERSSEIVIALSHHPFEWLRDKDDVAPTIRSYAHVHLYGHVHEAQNQRLRSGAGTDFIQVVSGAAHEDPASTNSPAKHGYNIGSLGIGDDAHAVLRIWPRIWSRQHNFRVDHETIPEVDSDEKPYREDYVDHELRFKLPDHRPVASETPTRPVTSTLTSVYSVLQPASAADTLSMDAEAWNDRAVALSEHGRYQEALGACEEALALKPDFPEAWNNKGAVLSEQGRCKEALEAYEIALRFNPQYPEAWHGKGWTLGCLQRNQEALEAYDKALHLRPNYSDAWYNKGVALLKLSRLQESLEALDEVLDRNPGDSQAWSNKGLALDYSGRYQQALEAYDRALQGAPFSPQACLGKGMTLAKLNRRGEAVVWLCRAWSRRGLLADKGTQVSEELHRLGHDPQECEEGSSSSSGSTLRLREGAELSEEEPSQPPASDAEIHTDLDEDHLERIVEQSDSDPTSALLRLSSLLEREVRVLLGSLGHMEAGLTMSLPQAIQFLVEQGQIPQHTISSLRIFWDLRNKVVHGDVQPDNEEISNIFDMGLIVLRAVRAIPHEINIVHHPGTEIYSDSECSELISNAVGLILETTSPGGSVTTKRIYPTTRRGYYRKGKRVAWEWSLDRVWGTAWYLDPDTNENKPAWTSSGEFVGRHTEEI